MKKLLVGVLMRKLTIIVLLLLIQISCYAQTRPHWTDIADTPRVITSSCLASDLGYTHLSPLKNGGFNIAAGATFTIDIPFVVGNYQVFYGSGHVVFTPGTTTEVKHVWFGNSAAGVNAALLAAGTIPVRITENITVEESIAIGSLQHLYMDDSIMLTAVPYAQLATAMIINRNPTAGDSWFQIRGGNFDGLGDTQTTHKPVIYLKNASNATLDNVKINNSGASISTTSGALFVEDSTKVNIINCVSNNANGVNNLYVFNSSFITIDKFHAENNSTTSNDSCITVNTSPYSSVSNCVLVNSAGSHISFNSTNGRVNNNVCQAGVKSLGWGITLGHNGISNAANYTTASSNVVYGMTKSGILIQGTSTSNVTVTGNTIVGSVPIVQGTTYAGVLVKGASRNTISNNIIRSMDTGIYISDDCADGSNIVGNVVTACAINGITLATLKNNVSSNRVQDCGQAGPPPSATYTAGIYVAPSSYYNQILGNVCSDTQASKTQQLGIEVQSIEAGYSTIVVGNSTTGNASTAGILAVTGTIVEHNR